MAGDFTTEYGCRSKKIMSFLENILIFGILENLQCTLPGFILINKLFETTLYLRPLVSSLPRIFQTLKIRAKLEKISKFNPEQNWWHLLCNVSFFSTSLVFKVLSTGFSKKFEITPFQTMKYSWSFNASRLLKQTL